MKSWTLTCSGSPAVVVPAVVLVLADQFLLLGVDADHRRPRAQVVRVVDVGELGVAIGCGCPRGSWRWPAGCSRPHAAIDASPWRTPVAWLRNARSGSGATSTSTAAGTWVTRVSGSISDSNVLGSPGSCSSARLRPPPGHRERPSGNGSGVGLATSPPHRVRRDPAPRPPPHPSRPQLGRLRAQPHPTLELRQKRTHHRIPSRQRVSQIRHSTTIVPKTVQNDVIALRALSLIRTRTGAR